MKILSFFSSAFRFFSLLRFGKLSASPFSFYISAIFSASLLPSFSQPYGNEWINYQQKYLELKITDTGIYRIDYAVLSQGLNSIGESIGSIDPRTLQLYGRGEEHYIFVEGENDGSFDNNDFIEFYAVKNDGWLDERLYESSSDQSNPYYSLFNDTATYYLTVGSVNGKRLSSAGFSVPGAATPYFFKEEVISFTSEFYAGEFYGSAQGAAHPLYKAGKGWFSNTLTNGATISADLSTSYAFTSGNPPDAALKITLAGANSKTHILQINYGINSFTETFSGYALKNYDLTLPASALSASTAVSVQSLSPASGLPDYTAISYIYLKYPRLFNLTGLLKTAMLLPPSADSSFISVTGYPDTQQAFIYDLTSHVRLKPKQSLGNILQANIPPNNAERKCYVFPTAQIKNINTLIPATATGKFTDYSANKDSAFVIITHASLMSGASLYKDYRNSIGHDAMVADIDELYDQFAYGINKHPLSIRNFCNFLLHTFSSPPQHLFLIGKAISTASFSTRNNASLYEQNLVPTFGWPSSDVAFTSGLNGNLVAPAIPSGRLAAKTNQEIQDYLNKVIQFEQHLIEGETTQLNISEKLWMKHVIHFAGGNDTNENGMFRGYLKEYENDIKNDLYGGHVTTVSKNSTAPVQVSLTDSIRNMIEEGVSLMTFFGHSSANYTDMSIGYAGDYDFKPGRYPLMIVNGCFSGDIYTPSHESTSENFVLTKEKGAIGYLAHTGLGYSWDLHNYTGSLYDNIAKNAYNQSIGQCIKQGITAYQPQNFTAVSTALGMTLHGDPAIRPNTHEKPDYAIARDYVYFTPSEVTTAEDSFDIHIIIANLGMAISDSVSILVKRTLANGTAVTVTSILAPVYYKDTFRLRLPVDAVNGAGLNGFYIHVDPNLQVDELSELNNIIGQEELTLNIKSGELIPVYPYNYAVVPNRNIVLKASTSDPFASSKEYIFQIDTTDTYNSPKMMQYTVTSAGGVVVWDINDNYFSLPDSTAYFWRTSPNNPADYRWREHSFQIIAGKTGWGQKHFYQFKNDAYSGINYLRDSLQFTFSPQQKGIRCELWGHPQSIQQYDQTRYLIDNAQQDYNSVTAGASAFYIAVIDKCTLQPWGTRRNLGGIWYNMENNFGNCNDQDGPHGRKWTVEYYFVFRTYVQAEMDSLRSLLINKIPKGNYVLAYCFGNTNFNDSAVWKPAYLQTFTGMGAVQMLSAPDTVPYIFFGQVGNPAAAKEKVGTSYNDFISLEANMTGCVDEGNIASTLIGPAYQWGSLHWRFFSDNPVRDSVKINLLNPSAGNSGIYNFNTYSGDVVPLDSLANAATYPFLRLRADMQDDSLFTCAQLAHWYVLYDEIPEAALDPKIGYAFHAGTIQQGDLLKFSIAIQNVSKAGMDSLRIKYRVESAAGTDSILIKKKQPLAAGTFMLDTVSFPTVRLNGNCRLWVEVNPQDSLWQLEQYHFNNVASLAFTTEKDRMNPLLDVTFDGVRILNGDIVSPKPEIIIQLKDENKFLAVEDTGKFKIFMTNPDKKTERIYFLKNGKEQMHFNKATLPENRCRIEYYPEFLKDGIYELKVQGSDASGNAAGDVNYAVTFEVISKSTITEVLNYPNPFSSSTRFVFTLTGSVIPDQFKVQILTVSGKVVREITREELGAIRIGRNITDYAWDGRDEYGDLLANGVYLYRVIVKVNGEEIEHRNSGADAFFKKGFGKMYLMR